MAEEAVSIPMKNPCVEISVPPIPASPAEKNLIPWWIEYRVENGSHGYAIGWLDDVEQKRYDALSPDTYLCLVSQMYEFALEPMTPAYGTNLTFLREDIVTEGPCILGQRITKAQYAKMQADQAAFMTEPNAILAEVPMVDVDETEMQRRGVAQSGVRAEPNVEVWPDDEAVRPDHDWGVI